MKFLVCFCLLLISIFTNGQITIHVHLDTSVKGTFTGRLYLLTQRDTTKQVSDQPDFNDPQAFFAKSVQNWKGSEVQLFTGNEEVYSKKFTELKPGYYKAVAIIDVNEEERAFNFSPGNAYSRKEAIIHIDSAGRGEGHIYINTIVAERQFRETERIKLLKLRSGLLSSFHGKDVFVKAAVVLPEGYETNQLSDYPIVFVIPGWGGTHYDVLRGDGPGKRYGFGVGKKKVFVYLNPETQTRWGLHAFIDSKVNGPWGKALVEEVFPYLQENYRVSKSESNYFLTGQSSGAYGALWLQMHYPKKFNGCWVAAPDPVDFSNFTGINIYTDKNFYKDKKGNERPLFIVGGKPLATMRKFATHDFFFGDGSQLQSFEAAFGNKDASGRPKEIFDRKTGMIHKNVAMEWRTYDLGMYLKHSWKILEPDLKNKIHIYVGSDDNFLLQGAVMNFRKKAEAVNASVVCEIIPGADHWSLWTTQLTEKIHRGIDSRITGQ
ncbi:MAG TPA: alpha/beta hydrolase-fold protein [Chitinophagaceae bacterium]